MIRLCIYNSNIKIKNCRMKTYLPILLICLCAGFISCSSDDEDDSSMKAYVPETYTSNFLNLESVDKWVRTDIADIPVGQVGLIKIEGGSSEYTAYSENDKIVKILMHPHNSKVFTVESQNILGSTTVIIKDEDNNSLSIPVTVSEYTETYWLCRGTPDVIIMAGETEPEETLKNSILEAIKERNILKGYTLELIYEKKISGKISIKNSKGEEHYSGTFEKSEDNKYTYLDLKVNDQEYHYTVTYDYSGLLKDLGPRNTHFVEDLTEFFQESYPELTKVLVVTTVCI